MPKFKGSALISALFIMTLVAIAATAMSLRLQLDIYRTQLVILSDKLYLASQAISFWAMSELSNPKNQFLQADDNGKVMVFPLSLQKMYPDFTLNGSLFDLQARLNLNNLTDKKYYNMFLNLLNDQIPNMQPKERLMLVNDTQQWISPYKPGRGNDQLVQYYAKQQPPYQQSQQLMQSISEFRLIRGVNAPLYQKLNDYLTALPEITPINFNTASKTILKTLGNGLNDSQLMQLIALRAEGGLTKLDKINGVLNKLNIRSDVLTIESQYFLCIATVSSPELSMTTYSVFKRSKNKEGQINIGLVSESVGAI